jgi:cell division protein FtsI (penicillin-binding protein 3)
LLDRNRARRPLALERAIAIAATGAALLAALACATPGDPDRARDPEPSTPAAGSSTLVATHQTIADSEIDRLQQELSPEAAAVIVLDPADGAILAVSSRSRVAGPDVALERKTVPGSTFKLLAIGAALEERVITADQRLACGRRAYGDQTLTDVGEFGTLALPEVVAVSSNVGISHVFDALGPERYGRWLSRFHVERPAAIGEGLPAAVLAIGQKLPVRPIEVAAIYATIANRGRYNPPTRERRAAVNEPVLGAATAQTLLRLLEGVVTDPRGTGRAAAIPGVRVAGKTGTADLGGGRHWASFAGIVPADAPRYVVFVGIEGPADRVTGGRTAAPAFARIATRLLGR